MRQLDQIIIHHSVTGDLDIDEAVRLINENHKRLHSEPNSLGYFIAYHYIIDSKGICKQTRAINEVGYQAGNLAVNNTSIGVCLVGNFETSEPSKQAIECLERLIAFHKVKYDFKIVQGHRDVRIGGTACPGKNLYNKISNLNQITMDKYRLWASSVGLPKNTPDEWIITINQLFKTCEQLYK